jgi:hypothetical protein
MAAGSSGSAGPLKLYAGNSWIYVSGDSHQARWNRFATSFASVLKSLCEGLILYDQVIVPTQDFLLVSGLLGVLGKPALTELIESGILKFVRLNGTYGYADKGLGVVAFKNHINGKESQFCAPMERAISEAITNLPGQANDLALARKIADVTTEVDAMELEQEIRNEILKDVSRSACLRQHFNMGADLAARIAELQNDKAEVRLQFMTDLNDDSVAPEINGIVTVLRMNLNLRLASRVGCMDGTSTDPIGYLIRAKADGVMSAPAASNGFATLCQIASLPDIGEGVDRGQIKVEELVRLNKKRSGTQFRKWFHEVCRTDPTSVAKEYVALLHEVPQVQTLPVRIMRFLAINAVGLIPGLGPIANLGAGVVDSFFIDSWLKGNSPKYFIDDLRQLAPGQLPKS